MAVNPRQTVQEKEGQGFNRSRAPVSTDDRGIERFSEDFPVKAGLPITFRWLRALDSRFPVFHVLFATSGGLHADPGPHVSKDH